MYTDPDPNLDSTDDVVYVNNSDHVLIQEVKNICNVTTNRTTKRDFDGECLFNVEFIDGTIDTQYQFLKLVVPDVLIHKDIIPILRAWNNTALLYPKQKRNCVITNEPTVPGTLFSKEHQEYQLYINKWM
tara:strand:+ start:1019 stop:1408 length:390 start_codon:yes stop_codon:yes gene_type:complete